MPGTIPNPASARGSYANAVRHHNGDVEVVEQARHALAAANLVASIRRAVNSAREYLSDADIRAYIAEVMTWGPQKEDLALVLPPLEVVERKRTTP